jgi:hypothetical protein
MLPRLPLAAALLSAAAAAAAAPAARSRFFEYAPPHPSPSSTAAPPLKGVVLPQDFADRFGAKCLDGTPPALQSLVQDPAKWVLFSEWPGTIRTCARSLATHTRRNNRLAASL